MYIYVYLHRLILFDVTNDKLRLITNTTFNSTVTSLDITHVYIEPQTILDTYYIKLNRSINNHQSWKSLIKTNVFLQYPVVTSALICFMSDSIYRLVQWLLYADQTCLLQDLLISAQRSASHINNLGKNESLFG